MKPYTTTRYALSLSLPAYAGCRLKLAYFTDMHNCCRPEEAEEVMTRISILKPDLVLCGGDSIVARPGEEVCDTVQFLLRIAQHFPLVIGTGNHEYRARLYPETYGSMYDDYREPLTGPDNICLLENAQRLFTVNGVPMRLYGFDLPRSYYKRFRRKTVPAKEIGRVFGAPDRESVTILLSHNPASLPACMEWGANLTLCGHYHGGILRIGRHSGLVSPEFRPFPSNVYGHFQTEDKHGIISSGCGEHTIPLRIRNPREIVSIILIITD
ncbi:MAG: metallophosphoesterase [Eubacterium sp.]|nr:metallophosphoesterase [Eubacterium sp.]